MPTETGRTWGKVPVNLPGGETVDVRVVTSITFADPVDRGQETQYTIINQIGTDQANRGVHIDTVEAQDGSGELKVERIDRFRVLDPVDRGQETYTSMDNSTGNDSTPPHFTTHIRTHKTKFLDKTNSETFIQTEWIDEFVVKDPVDRGQETHYYVTGNPPDDDSSQATDNDPDVSGGTENGEGDGGDPVRTDWFQNIVDLSTARPECSVRIQNITFTGTTTGAFDSGTPLDDPEGGGANPPPLGLASFDPLTQVMDGSYITNFSNIISSQTALSRRSHPTILGDGPDVSPATVSFSFSRFQIANLKGFFFDGADHPATVMSAGPGVATTPSGPPLIVNEKVIPGFSSLMSFTLGVQAVRFESVEQLFSGTALVAPTSDWWNYDGAARGFVATNVGSYTITISPDPFVFNGKGWKAIGIAAGANVNVPPFGFSHPGLPDSGYDVSVYIVRAPEADP